MASKGGLGRRGLGSALMLSPTVDGGSMRVGTAASMSTYNGSSGSLDGLGQAGGHAHTQGSLQVQYAHEVQRMADEIFSLRRRLAQLEPAAPAS